MEKLPNITINYSSVKRYLKFNDISFSVFIKPVFDSRSFQYSHLFQYFNIIQFKTTPNIELKCTCVKYINFLNPRLKVHHQGNFNKSCKNRPKLVQYVLKVWLIKTSFAEYFNRILMYFNNVKLSTFVQLKFFLSCTIPTILSEEI